MEPAVLGSRQDERLDITTGRGLEAVEV